MGGGGGGGVQSCIFVKRISTPVRKSHGPKYMQFNFNGDTISLNFEIFYLAYRYNNNYNLFQNQSHFSLNKIEVAREILKIDFSLERYAREGTSTHGHNHEQLFAHK